MIEIVGLVGLVAFVATSLVVGLRILLLATRTKKLPETCVGLSLVLAGGVGLALAVVPDIQPDLSPDSLFVIYELSSGLSHVGYVFLYVFVWRVFRPREKWAAVLFGLSTTALVVSGFGMALELQPGQALSGRNAIGGLWFWMSLASRFVVYVWATIESFRYHAMLKRRLVLGLAETSVVARFFHWGICTSAIVGIWINIAAQQLLVDFAWVQASTDLISALLGFVVSGALWYAFFPTRRRAAVPDSDANVGSRRSVLGSRPRFTDSRAMRAFFSFRDPDPMGPPLVRGRG